MMRVALVNPPFASARRPSLALTQLKWAAEQKVDGLNIDVHYLNLDVVPIVGAELYDAIAHFEFAHSVLGEWLFRSIAFPNDADNAEQYLAWLAGNRGSLTPSERDRILEVRDRIVAAFPAIISERGLHSYDVVGSTSMFQQTLPSLALFSVLRRLNSELVTVLGGANCEDTMGQALATRCDSIDVVFTGEALATFPRFLTMLDVTKGNRRDVLRDVPPVIAPDTFPSLTHSRPPGRVDVSIRTSRRVPADRSALSGASRVLDEIPRLDYEDFFAQRADRGMSGSDVAISFETSKGCWWGERTHCTFCGLNGSTMTYAAAPPEQAIAHINDLLQRYGDRCSEFDAVDNIMAKNYFSEVLPGFKVPTNCSLFYEIKANIGDAEVAALKAARVLRIQPGIEALSTPVLRMMRKGSNAFQNVRLLRACGEQNISVLWNLLVGFPGEDDSVYERYCEMMPSLYHLPPPTGVFPIEFHRFSPYHATPAQFGLKLVPHPSYEFLFPGAAREWLERVAYNFVNMNLRSGYLRSLARYLPLLSDCVGKWRDLWATDGSRPRLEISSSDGLETNVLDTRAEPVSYVLGPPAGAILELLERPRGIPATVQKLCEIGVSERDSRDAISTLRERRLLFEEGQTAMTLGSRGRNAPSTTDEGAELFSDFIRRLGDSRKSRYR